MNTAILIGRTTSDIELKATPSGKTVATFSLAVKRPYSKDTTDFIDMVAWNKTAETLAQYVKKGHAIAISKGHIETRTWKDQEGKTRKATEVVVEEFEFLEKKQTNDFTQTTPQFEDINNDEDLPF